MVIHERKTFLCMEITFKLIGQEQEYFHLLWGNSLIILATITHDLTILDIKRQPPEFLYSKN